MTTVLGLDSANSQSKQYGFGFQTLFYFLKSIVMCSFILATIYLVTEKYNICMNISLKKDN